MSTPDKSQKSQKHSYPELKPEQYQEMVFDLIKKVDQLEARNAAIEKALKHACRTNCHFRLQMLCDLDCPVRDYCGTGGLTLWVRERLSELLKRPGVCLGNAGDVY